MYTLAVCESSFSDSARLQDILDDYEHKVNGNFTVRNFYDGGSLLVNVLAGKCIPDVLIADVSLPDMSGLEAVKRMRSAGFDGEVIFTAKTPDHAMEAFELDARQYFVKPVIPEKLYAVLEKILVASRKYIVVKHGRSLRKVMCSEILYFETQGKHQIIHTHTEEIPVRISAREMQKTCPPPPL